MATPESGLTPVFEESFKTFKSKEPTYPGGLPAPPWPLKSLSDLEADPDPDGEGQYFRMDAVIDKKNYLAAKDIYDHMYEKYWSVENPTFIGNERALVLDDEDEVKEFKERYESSAKEAVGLGFRFSCGVIIIQDVELYLGDFVTDP